MAELERWIASMKIEVRAAEAGAAPEIAGYAAVYNNLSDDLGGFRERLLPGSFAGALLPGADVRALWQHEAAYVLGRTVNGSLRLSSDEHGLQFAVDPPDTSWARDAVVSLRRGDVNQMSFGFYVPEGGDEWRTEDGMLVRTVRRVELLEISPVTFAAYPATSVAVRELAARLRAQAGRVDPEARVRAQAQYRERVLTLA